VGARKPAFERVQQVHELTAPADRLCPVAHSCPFLSVCTLSSPRQNSDELEGRNDKNSKNSDPLEQETDAMSDVTVVPSIVAIQASLTSFRKIIILEIHVMSTTLANSCAAPYAKLAAASTDDGKLREKYSLVLPQTTKLPHPAPAAKTSSCQSCCPSSPPLH
jgi:hypothetical protein